MGTQQQLKEIPTETQSLIPCRLLSGWLSFHYPEPCQDTRKLSQAYEERLFIVTYRKIHEKLSI